MSWTIKEQEKAKYDQIFEGLVPVNGLLNGDKVKPILLNSKLPVAVLGNVWELSDIDKDGMLDRDEFCIAMHLVYKTLERTPLPQCLPPELIPPSKRNLYASPVIPPVINKIVITASEKAHYDSLFRQYDTDEDGLVGGVDVKEVFLKTGLPQHTLAHIWNLSDLTSSGKLNKDQFQLAMCLVGMKLQGHPLPPSISPHMLPSSIQLPTPEDTLLLAGNMDESSSKELDLIMEEINTLKSERMCLERELAQNEADMRLEERETTNVHKELEGMLFSQKQLECRKIEAQKRSDELDEKKKKLQTSVSACKGQFEGDQLKIQELRHKLNNTKPMSQEEETEKLRGEIERLGGEEIDVEARYIEAINAEKRLNEKIKQLEIVLAQVSDSWEGRDEAEVVGAFGGVDALKVDPFNNFDPFPKSQHDPFGGDSLAEHFNESLDVVEADFNEVSANPNTDPWGEGHGDHDNPIDDHVSEDIGSFGFGHDAPADVFTVDNLDPFGTGSFQAEFTTPPQLPALPPKKKRSPAPPRPPAPKPLDEALSAANLTAAKLLNQEKKSKFVLEAEQLAWAKRDSEEDYERVRRMKEKEQQDLEMALALSRKEMGGR